MDFYEELMSIYLAVINRFFILHQASILKDVEGRPWLADIDHLAIDFRNQKILLVEVSKGSARPNKIVERLSPKNYVNIERYIKEEILLNELKRFKMEWWFFVREANVQWVENHRYYSEYISAGGSCKVRSIESVLDDIKKKWP